MKKGKRIVAGILGVILFLAPVIFFDGMTGEPVGKANAARRAEAYAEALYPGQTFHVSGVVYDGPFVFRAEVQSHERRDTHFSVTTAFYLRTSDEDEHGTGDHDRLVESGWNTLFRMGEEAADLAAAVIRLKLPELELVPLYGVGQRRVFIELGYEEGAELIEKAGGYKELIERDAYFDPALLSEIPAHFSAVVQWDGVPTESDAEDVLAKIRAVLEENGLPMSYYSITLWPGGDEPSVSTGTVRAENIG